MEFELISNPLLLTFKLDDFGIVSEEIEDPSKFPSLYEYIFDNSNKRNKNQLINIIDILTKILKKQRSVSAYFEKYNNKSIYIYLFELFLKEKNTPKLRTAIIDLISEFTLNIQISKDEYEFIFQKLSKLYRKEKNFLEHIKSLGYTFNDYFSSLCQLLYTTFSCINEEKVLPYNYFSCFGKNSFNLSFNNNLLEFGNSLTFILSFKITKSSLMEKNPKIFDKCRLITINFEDTKKMINIELRYPNCFYLLDGNQEIKATKCKIGEWINLIITIQENSGYLTEYLWINEENNEFSYKVKNVKLNKKDRINSITFFDNFYGEVTSIIIFSQKYNDSLNIINKNFKVFFENKRGLCDKRHIINFVKNVQNISYNEKKRDKGGGNLYDDIIGIFTPINFGESQSKIIENCLGKYFLEINGNIRNHKYCQYQKCMYLICSINNFLPIIEMLIIYKKELLNENNFVEYLKLISKIIYGKDNLVIMNKSKFFKILGLILEQIPNGFFTKNILNEFENFGNIILEQNIKGFSSDFFKEILLNEKIILKYNIEQKSSFWNKVLQLYLTNKDKMRYYLNTKILCNILLFYDHLSHQEMCCEFHLNMYKKEFIENMKVMKPNLNYQLLSLKMLIQEHILSQNFESIESLVQLLIVDLSPCMTKIILEILINIFCTKSNKEEWRKNIIMELINVKYVSIFVNLFNYSLPDVRYEILILMLQIYISLLKQNDLKKFDTFKKMIKTCLLPSEVFFVETKGNNIMNLNQNKTINNSKDSDKNSNIIKNNVKVNNDINLNKENNTNKEEKVDNKEKENNQSDKIKKVDDKKIQIKPNSILSIANKFESKNKNDNKKANTIIKSKPSKLSDNITKIFEAKSSSLKNPLPKQNFQNKKNSITKNDNNNINNNNSNQEKTQNKNDNNSQGTKDNTKKQNINHNEDCKENKHSKDNLIIKSEIYDIYIDNLYNLLFQWVFGFQIDYSSSKSQELFTLSKKNKKNDEKKIHLMMNLGILEILFALNENLDDINFTSKLLNDLKMLIELQENAYVVMINDKIIYLLLDLILKHYKEKNNKENEIYKTGVNILTLMFINCLKYLRNQHIELPIQKLEIIFLWGDKTVNKANNGEIIYDLINDLLITLMNEFKNSFMEELSPFIAFTFKMESLFNDFFYKNYLLFLNYIYYFYIHYKIDAIINKSNLNSFYPSTLNINFPNFFISGLRIDDTKGNNIKEYLKDYNLIEIVLIEIDYIFSYRYIKNKIYNNKLPTKIIAKANIKEKEIEYDKYNKILNDLIFDTSKRNLFYNELNILCFNLKDNKASLIKMISITYESILSIVKHFDDESQFILWLDKYKNLLRFTALSSINLNKNKNDTDMFDIIQNSFLEVISSGLCFLCNLYETCPLFTEQIKRVINNIFLLCFSILKIYFNKKLFSNVPEIYSYPNAVVTLFNEYIKDKNKSPLINSSKLDKKYLNPSYKIYDLINENEFMEAVFLNENLKNKLYQNFYSISLYKSLVDQRYKKIINIEDKLDFSYQSRIQDLFSELESGNINLYNKRCKNYVKNRKEYKRQKQQIFTFNGMWSNKELFYGNINSGKIKYKIMNHYTKNFMRPLISPIFDINYYLPNFSSFKAENLFLKDNSKENIEINSYDLILDFEQILMISKKSKPENKNSSQSLSKKAANKLSLRERYYKQDQKYYDFLEKMSELINEEINGEPNPEYIEEKNSLEEEKLKINDLPMKRAEKLNTVSTRPSTLKEVYRKERISFDSSFVNLSYDKEKGKIKHEEIFAGIEYVICCLVKSTHHIKGLFYFKDKKISFKTFFGKILDIKLEMELNEKDDNYDSERNNCYGSYFKSYKKDKNFYKLRIKYNDIRIILKRKYYYNNSAIEIFTSKNKSYIFNFVDENVRKTILNELLKKIGDFATVVDDMKESNNKNNKENSIGYFNNRYFSILTKNDSKKTTIKISKLVKLWKSWEISNFEFLMYLNIFSNRSYNDISQYPVFPWILSNYEDPLIKEKKNIFTNDENDIVKDYLYRDLSVPMGMLSINEDSSRRSINYSSTFQIISEDKNISKPYFYGCNYSNPTYICNYLIRIFPFSQACIEIQGTGFDNPHRLFSSIIKTFKNASTQSTDVRELIPEFFYLPEMYFNLNNLDLGKLSNKEQVGDVITPCNNNPYEFTIIMKNLLEGENISAGLNNWIDLIFGIKAKDKEAKEAKNLFTEQAYQEDIDLDIVDDKNSVLRYVEFGLIPNQLFNGKELEKKDRLDDVKKIKQITDPSYILKYNKNKKSSSNNTGKINDLFLIGIKNTSNDKFIYVYNNGQIIEKKLYISSKDCSEEIISKNQIMSNINKIGFNFIHYIQDYKNIKIIRDGKIIILGGFYDGKITVFQNDTDSNQSIIDPFKDDSIVTIINTDIDENFLFIGNNMGNISIILISPSNINDWKEIYSIPHQLNIISSIESNNLLNVWASASIDGYINLYTLPKCKLNMSFKLETSNFCNNIFICDSPLPSILIICKDEVFLYSINGHKIYSQKEYSNIINPIIIKDFIKNDFFAYIINEKEILIRNVSDFTLVSSIEIDREIYYLVPNENNKALFAFNKDGTEINAITCESKKDKKKGIEITSFFKF